MYIEYQWLLFDYLRRKSRMENEHQTQLTYYTRRDFLKKSLTIGTALSLSPSVVKRLGAEDLPLPAFPDLAVVIGDAVQATKRSLTLMGGISRFVKRGDRVVLKPNMSFPNPPSMATTTHPEIVATVAKSCLEAGAKKVMVLDHTLRRPDICLQRSGIEAACKNLDDVFVLGLAEEKFFEEVPVSQGRVLSNVKVIKGVMDADGIINLPVAKSHATTTVSLGMKNLMGLIWDRRVFHSRMDINEALVDLNTVIKPTLILVDATRVLTNGGPGGPGKVLAMNTVVAGTDPVAVDAYTVTLSQWYGKSFTPLQIKHVEAAARRGVGEIDLEKLTVVRQEA